ncbi:MAG: host-nuclease inhibitor Gam family protein [Syntrophobacter sp.]
MAKKVKQQASTGFVPQTKEDVIAAIAEIGRHQRERARIEAAMNDELATVKERCETEAGPHNEAIASLSQGVQIWCEANRNLLTQGGKVKSAILPSGEVKWRMRPPSVSVRGKEIVIETLKRLGLDRFVRSTEEVNKEAILAEQQAVRDVKGITISQGEDFVIEPFEQELESVAVV